MGVGWTFINEENDDDDMDDFNNEEMADDNKDSSILDLCRMMVY